MSTVLITDTHLTNIADAIRGKLRVNTTYRPGGMAGAIKAIPLGNTYTGEAHALDFEMQNAKSTFDLSAYTWKATAVEREA